MVRNFSNNQIQPVNAFTIQKMRFQHLPYVVAIEKQSFKHPWSYSLFLSELSNKIAHYFVALLGNKLIGYIGLWIYLREAHITTFAIHPDFRGKGYGKRLLHYAFDFAKNKGCKEILLEVRTSNKVAQALYRKLGFSQIGLRKSYYSDGEDALVMKKNL
ncbi:MAG: ribosomal protein S18-alanine N-acetyltransferase [Candidatus Atribacteria bacterium]|nr:ribosomal protein S18-alanine N-acetyltransferase [Candidatus Atribacteria bacterium]MCD6349168.1 ribosomal protein S18-alanine N-acetyltransferase [Candidatus Atribacteria bacterium]